MDTVHNDYTRIEKGRKVIIRRRKRKNARNVVDLNVKLVAFGRATRSQIKEHFKK